MAGERLLFGLSVPFSFGKRVGFLSRMRLGRLEPLGKGREQFAKGQTREGERTGANESM